jgi:protease IV
MKKRPFLLGFVVFSAVAVVFFLVIISSFSLLDGAGFPGDVFGLNPNIGVVEITGVIDSSRGIMRAIREYGEDDSIAGLLVRIDSPGGVVAPTQEIFAELRKTATRWDKPIVASLGSTAASGGYYVAAGCDYIVANPGTLTGSIGVIMEFLSMAGAFEKLGLKSQIVKTGKFKDAGNYSRELTLAERTMLQETIDSVHRQFVSAVAEGRELEYEQVAAIADGRIFSGQQALDLGLVDELGTYYDAVDVLKRTLGITGDVTLISPKPRKPDLLDLFLDGVMGRMHAWESEKTGAETGRLYYR